MKLKAFQAYLRKEKIDFAYLFDDDPNLTYLTQYATEYARFIVTPRKAHLFISSLEALPKRENLTIKHLTKDFVKSFPKEPKRIAINKSKITLEVFEAIKKRFKKAKFVDCNQVLTKLREQKTSKEIAKIRKACTLTDNALKALIKELPKKKLKTEMDVALFLENHIRKQGGELAFPTIAANGKNAATPHYITSNKQLKRGVLLLDFGAKYQNYCADMTRCLFLGKPTKEEKSMYELLLTSQKNTIKSVNENSFHADITASTQKELGKFAKYTAQTIGHGLGIEVHESPRQSPRFKDQMQEGHTFTIEPGLYFPNKFGLRIEDTLLFTKGKAQRLTKSPKELTVIAW